LCRTRQRRSDRRNIYKCVERTPAPRHDCFGTPRRGLDARRLHRGLKKSEIEGMPPFTFAPPARTRAHTGAMSGLSVRCGGAAVCDLARSSIPMHVVPADLGAHRLGSSRSRSRLNIGAGAFTRAPVPACTETLIVTSSPTGSRLFRARRSRQPESFRLIVVSARTQCVRCPTGLSLCPRMKRSRSLPIGSHREWSDRPLPRNAPWQCPECPCCGT
jgi:hypothetical protein